MARNKEINVYFHEGCLDAVKNIPKGITVVTHDEDRHSEDPLIIRRWKRDGTNQRVK